MDNDNDFKKYLDEIQTIAALVIRDTINIATDL